MRTIFFCFLVLSTACSSGTSGGGGTPDATLTDAKGDANADSDSLSDTSACPDSSGAGAALCCCNAGTVENPTCVAGGWTCPHQAGAIQGDACVCPGPPDTLSDLVDTKDIDAACTKQPTCCCNGCNASPSVCIAGMATCPTGVLGTMAGSQCMCECADVPQPDIPDTIDTQPQCEGPAGLCCCAGDVAAQPICVGNSLGCPAGFGTYYGEQCNGSKCGGPCSLPCPMDTGPDVTEPDTAGDSQIDPPTALCLSTGGTVSTGPCCTSQGDFPNTCGIGGCSCAPAYLHDIHKCDCGAGKCFDPAVGCQ